MKEKIGACFLLFLRILGASWLVFLISFVPLYIVRGAYHNKTVENIVMTIIGMLFGFVVLTILQMRDDKAHRYQTKELVIQGVGAVGIYVLGCILLHLPSQNNYPIAVLGNNFAQVLGTNADGYPLFPSVLISAFVFGAIYFFAFLLGSYIARRRYTRLMNK